jgi:uncharacterized protein YbaR (Trm112 family)
MMLDARLLEILACPLCKSPLRHDVATAVLPVMLENEARALNSDDPLLDR